MKLSDKWNKWEQDNYVTALKALCGVMSLIPAIGIYGVVQAYYSRNLADLCVCLVIVSAGTVLTTLLAIVTLDEHRTEKYNSVRRHPVTN